jgi:SAM-dependent methyltransferase
MRCARVSPWGLFDDVVSLSGIPPGGRALEIGCGTGQATLPFARRGFRILCVEVGDNLAAVARRNLASYPRAEVLTADFEDVPLPEGAFDLAISATAFYWLDPAVAYPKAARALRPEGALALFWNEHVFSDASGGFFEAAQEVYEREMPEIVKPDDHKGLPQPHELPDRTAEIEASGLFDGVIRQRLPVGRALRRGGPPARPEHLLRPHGPGPDLPGAPLPWPPRPDRRGVRRAHRKGYATTLYVVRRK